MSVASSVPSGNSAIQGRTAVSTTGANIGAAFEAASGTFASVGVIGKSITSKASTPNVGGIFYGRNVNGTAPVSIGAYVSLESTEPTLTTSSGLIVNNGDRTAPIALFQDNGTAVLTVADGGRVTSSSGFVITPVTVAGLPSDPVDGMRHSVTDSNAVSFTAGIGAVVAGGGTTHVPVFFDGTNWRIG